MNTKKNYIEVGGLLWSLDLLSGGRGHVNPDNGIYYYTQDDAIAEAEKQGLRLPTKKEFAQFCKQTTHEWIERDGREGMLFTDKRNGSSIFFPALGYRNYGDGAIYNEGTYGNYWSESVYSATYGYYLHFNSGYVSPQYNYNRRYVFPVRCLIPKQNPINSLPHSALCQVIIDQMQYKKISFYRINKDTKISLLTLYKIKKNDLTMSTKTLTQLCQYLGLEIRLHRID